jgi:hypothetical protein
MLGIRNNTGGERSSSSSGSVATGKSCAWQLGFPQCGSGSGDSECIVGKQEVIGYLLFALIREEPVGGSADRFCYADLEGRIRSEHCERMPLVRGSKASDDPAAGHSGLSVVQAGVLRTWVVHFRDAARSSACVGQPPPRRAGYFPLTPNVQRRLHVFKHAASFSAGTLLGSGRLITIIILRSHYLN